MVTSAWVRLPKPEYDRVWDQFYAEFDFRPSTDAKLFPAIREPRPSVTWSIESAWSDPDPLMRQTHSAFNEAMLALFKQVISESASLIVLDWHHPGYRFLPYKHSGSFVPTRHAKGEPATWEVPVLPDGDYYIFLSEDFRFGTFGHPWESSICVWGAELLEAMSSLPLEGATIIRRNGLAV